MAIDLCAKLFFNGINGVTGSYLFEPMSSTELAQVAMGNTLDKATGGKEHLAELKFRNAQKDAAHFGVKEGIDATKLEQAGWGVIFPAVAAGSAEAREQEAIREALSPLLRLRQIQATRTKEHYYKEYRGALGYRPGESKQKYLARLGTGPGPADPDKVPYYLLIVGSPQVIPFHVQYQIDVQYAVGRIHFDTIREYNNYARSVVAAETGGLSLSREVAFIGVANPDDMATQLSRKNLVGPLADMAEGWADVPDWEIGRYFDDQADKANVSALFGGPKTPALIFSGSHGMGFDRGSPMQRRHQGALLLQDWPGPKEWKGPIGEELYFSGDDLRSDAGLLGLISFNFACYGGGTPQYDEFSKRAFKERKAIADEAFVAGLHRKLLSHPKGGALASIGHVERAWGYSFMWGSGKGGASQPQLAVFESTMKSLMKGIPVGMAIEYFNERYAEIASDLSLQIEELEFDPEAVDAYALADMWTSNNDARGYAILGDPAVRLQFGDDSSGDTRRRDAIDVSSFGEVSARDLATMPTTAQPHVSEPDASEAATPSASASVEFGLFEGEDESDEYEECEESDEYEDDANAQPVTLGNFINKVIGALGEAIDDTQILEVRTYISCNASGAEAVDHAGPTRDGDLCAFTRITIDGDTETIVPQRDGVIDTVLWKLHLEMVKQARDARAETIKTVLSAISDLITV